MTSGNQGWDLGPICRRSMGATVGMLQANCSLPPNAWGKKDQIMRT